jgi:hypothetical protein
MATRTIIWCLALVTALIVLPDSVGQTPDNSREGAAVVLTPAVRLGARFLLKHQQRDGGWCENNDGGRSCVAHTSLAALALLRAGCQPRNGPRAEELDRAIRFVCTQIDNSGKTTLFLTPQKLTIHRYLGRPIDIALALNLLAEARGRMPDDEGEQRVTTAATAIVAKLKPQQRIDGTWLPDGTTPEVAHALTIKALHRARHAGIEVDKTVIDKAVQAYGRRGAFANPLTLGTSLSSDAIVLSIWSDALSSVQRDMERARASLRAATHSNTPMTNHLDYLEKTEREFKKTIADILQKIEWKTHIHNATVAGGENLVSYLFMSELLLTIGAQEDWDKRLAAVLERQQNSDGSWAGNHCGAGKNFCTALAVLVLLADRAPVVLEARQREAAGDRQRRTAEPPSMLDSMSPGSK